MTLFGGQASELHSKPAPAAALSLSDIEGKRPAVAPASNKPSHLEAMLAMAMKGQPATPTKPALPSHSQPSTQQPREATKAHSTQQHQHAATTRPQAKLKTVPSGATPKPNTSQPIPLAAAPKPNAVPLAAAPTPNAPPARTVSVSMPSASLPCSC